jgi:hypothetical protein
MTQRDIDVRFEHGLDPPPDIEGGPCLTWEHHPFHGDGWILWYRDSDGVDDVKYIPGALTEVAAVVASAREWLDLIANAR